MPFHEAPDPGLGTWIKQRRRSLGLTQVDLAERIGVSQQYVSLLEKGEHDSSFFPVPMACAIAEALDLHPARLVEAGLRTNRERLNRYLEVRLRLLTIRPLARTGRVGALPRESSPLGSVARRQPAN